MKARGCPVDPKAREEPERRRGMITCASDLKLLPMSELAPSLLPASPFLRIDLGRSLLSFGYETRIQSSIRHQERASQRPQSSPCLLFATNGDILATYRCVRTCPAICATGSHGRHPTHEDSYTWSGGGTYLHNGLGVLGLIERNHPTRAGQTLGALRSHPSLVATTADSPQG